MKILAIISARGNSKGLPNKHLLNLKGKPLLAWTIEAAQNCDLISRTILSSEDKAIIACAKQYNLEVPFVRPAALSDDTVPGIEPVLHALTQCTGYTHVLLLQPTSPLRTAEDITNVINRLITQKAPACVSITRVQKHPNWMFHKKEDATLAPFQSNELILHRQALSPLYYLNGAIYLAEVAWLQTHKTFVTRETVGYEMPIERAIDIDAPFDFACANALLNSQYNASYNSP